MKHLARSTHEARVSKKDEERLAAFGLSSDGNPLPDPFENAGNGINVEPFEIERGARKRSKKPRPRASTPPKSDKR